ncbi:MAG TPA: hypothetical protein IAD32_04900 [Candidatus Scatavimonas merdigallinarum]|uniref:Uncharacterized protein n=1 Tax=Candidatus Scatavimonas merdigallinarum TaxID=2840914 RepID=A0A9D0ZHA8_9FIRM|nr:hypothetical protein [Candidatus Scatavimonas merdigallinarum]
MVLYHLSTTYQLLYCIAHRLSRHPDEEAGLFMVEYIWPETQRDKLLQKLQKTGWFSFVRLIPENQFKLRRGNALTESSTPEEIQSVIRSVCICMEKWLHLDLSSFSKIYIGSDQWSFGIYCLANRIPHVYIEDASGMLSQRKRYMQITKEINLTNYVISEFLHGAGTSEYETARLCDMRNFVEGFTDEKAENFSIYDALKYEIPGRVPEILAFYGATPVTVTKRLPVCIYMTQFLKTMAVKDLDVQEQITTLLVDYFASDCKLVIKPHPKDIWLNYRRIFPGAEILPCRLNAELLPFVFSHPVQRVLTASSTSVGGMAPFAGEVYAFTTEIETGYERLHAYYVAAFLLLKLATSEDTPLALTLSEVQQTQLYHFLKILHVPIQARGLPVYVTGNPALQEADFQKNILLLVGDSGEESLTSLPFTTCLPPDKSIIWAHAEVCPEEGSLLTETSYNLYLVIEKKQLHGPLPVFCTKRVLRYSKAVLSIEAKIFSKTEKESRTAL